MIQQQDLESQRQRAWSFNAALFLLTAFGVSALVALWIGDWIKAAEISSGTTIVTVLIAFSKYYNQPVQQTSFEGKRSISELPESVANDQDQKDL